MKTKTAIIAILIIALAGGLTFTFATGTHTTKIQATGIAKAAVKKEVPVTQIEVKGIVKQSETGLSLYDGNETYRLEGDEALEKLVGSLVKINGSVHKSVAGLFIVVKTATKVN